MNTYKFRFKLVESIDHNYKEQKKYNFIKNKKNILKNIQKKNININKVIKQPRS